MGILFHEETPFQQHILMGVFFKDGIHPMQGQSTHTGAKETQSHFRLGVIICQQAFYFYSGNKELHSGDITDLAQGSLRKTIRVGFYGRND